MWKVSLSKVCVEEEEFSFHENVAQALAAWDEIEDFLGTRGLEQECLTVKQSPVTGELLMVTVTEVRSD